MVFSQETRHKVLSAVDWTLVSFSKSQDVKKTKTFASSVMSELFYTLSRETHTRTHTPGSLLEKQKSLSSLKKSGGSSWKSSGEVVLLSCSSCGVFSGCWHVMFEGQFFNEVEVMTTLLIGHRRLRLCCPGRPNTKQTTHIITLFPPKRKFILQRRKHPLKRKRCFVQPLQSGPNAEHNMKTISVSFWWETAERWEKMVGKRKKKEKNEHDYWRLAENISRNWENCSKFNERFHINIS